ncbi:Vegetative incompatibility protein HET-E-1 [Lachnellula arida]|uniref:Vegetative incompatibility protein HET-E-1 n=1 Tax=Lachnellula arida TaxID=1316785 RepID=A0A8T9BM32_9HELO|nr:Vegetative incompatibility protein HET-E-1 [Lachnellula arida]
MSRIVGKVFGRSGKDNAKEARKTEPQTTTARERIAPEATSSVALQEQKLDLYSTVGYEGIKVVAEPTDAELDIVFVHGLTGNRDTTWTHKNGVFWPQLLAEDIKAVRIMTFGYDANPVKLWGAVNGSNLRNHGKALASAVSDLRREFRQRPLLFIAHSLGGLVCEQALLYCREGAEPNLKKLFQSTRGVIFMGTPHAGSHLADWGYRLAKFLNVIRGTNSALLDPLRQKSNFLRAVQEQFQQLLLQPDVDIKIHCFFEEKDVLGVGRIVPEHSAVLNQYPNHGIAANHMDMTKFSGDNDSEYAKVLGRLRDNIDLINSPNPSKRIKLSEVPGAAEYEIGANQRVSNTGSGIGMIGQQNVQGGFHMHASNQTDPGNKCHQLFRTSEYEQYKDRNPDPVEGTCKWFLQHSNYTRWKNHPMSSLLWVSADPGYGKSVLSKLLVDKELQTAQSPTTCFFFFKDDNEKQKTATNALCAILHQLFSQKPELLKYAIEIYDQNGCDLIKDVNVLWRLLAASADPHAGEIICVLDALDECRKSEFRILIRNLCLFYDQCSRSSDHTSLKFLVTSRPLEYIENEFSDITHELPTIRLPGEEDTDQIRSEIDLVIQYELGKIQRKHHLGPETIRILQDKLTNVEHRTYLWLKLVIELLDSSQSITRQGRDKIFGTIPPTVNAAYTAILNRSTDKKQAWKLLNIVCAAVEPLSVNELSIAMLIRESDRSYTDLEIYSTEFSKRWIRNLCGLFVSVIDGRVYLLHQTAKEFLLEPDNSLQSTPNIIFDGKWTHSISIPGSNFVLAQSCMWYLHLDELDGRVCTPDQEAVNNLKSQFPFLAYSAYNWGNHYQATLIPEENNLHNIAFQLSDVSAGRGKAMERLSKKCIA